MQRLNSLTERKQMVHHLSGREVGALRCVLEQDIVERNDVRALAASGDPLPVMQSGMSFSASARIFWMHFLCSSLHVRWRSRAYVCMYTHTHIHTDTHIYTHARTHARTHTRARTRNKKHIKYWVGSSAHVNTHAHKWKKKRTGSLRGGG
jgi:hypothetical protein